MVDQRQSPRPQDGVSGRPQPGVSGATQTSGSKGQERLHGIKEMGLVGRDVPMRAKRGTRRSRSRPATRAVSIAKSRHINRTGTRLQTKLSGKGMRVHRTALEVRSRPLLVTSLRRPGWRQAFRKRRRHRSASGSGMRIPTLSAGRDIRRPK